ncbi:hypothetical protein K402DRAFT_186465 [Aulographum hederae CBS 113979]|uniref:Secreted protein n=1 Tax=Aulographum hederae CBS 113979 TaxID=1176131 RepID=A0A6G1GQ01_9PEZI|nr:hypothetical protein K402DRAFT_186465 [Aulographum hederae CBS 113979]
MISRQLLTLSLHVALSQNLLLPHLVVVALARFWRSCHACFSFSMAKTPCGEYFKKLALQISLLPALPLLRL